MSLLEVGIGSALVAAAAILTLRPGVTRWLSDKLNRDRFNLETGGERAAKKYEFNVRFLQVFIPLVLGITGVGFVVRGIWYA
jgi:hypothetical protein